MPVDLGDVQRLTAECRSPSVTGTLTNATTVTLTITLPDLTTVTPAVTNPPATTGQYRYDYTTTQAGRHTARWVFASPSDAHTESFEVRDTADVGLFSVADAKEHANIGATVTTWDEELRGFIGATTRIVEWRAGVVVQKTYTEDHNLGSSPGVCLFSVRRWPAISLTSITPIHTNGYTYTVADLDLDGATGIVQRKDGGYMYGRQRVVYRAGRVVVPDNLILAGQIIFKHLWETQRGSTRRDPRQSADEVMTPIGYSIPRRALELLGPDDVGPRVG